MREGRGGESAVRGGCQGSSLRGDCHCSHRDSKYTSRTDTEVQAVWGGSEGSVVPGGGWGGAREATVRTKR